MGEFSEFDAILRLLPALAVVVVIPLGVLWWSRQRRGPARQWVRISAKTPLGKNNWVAVVEADQRRFLVGTGERGVGLIAELDELPQEPDDDRMDGDREDDADPRTGLIRRLQDKTLRRAGTSEGTHSEYSS